MASQSRTRPLIEGALMVALTVAITLFSVYAPLLGLVTLFFVPIPLIVLQVRQGLRITLVAVVATGLLTIGFMGLVNGLLVGGGLWLMALSYGHAVRRKLGALASYAITAAATSVGAVATWAGTLLILGEDSLAQAGAALNETVKEFIRINGARLTPEQIDLLQRQAALATDWADKYVLVMLIGSALLMALIVYLAAGWVLPRVGITVPRFPPFARWQLPLMPVLLVWAVGLVVTSGAGRFPQLAPFVPVASNLYSLCTIAFIIEGLAVGYFFLTAVKVPPVLRVVLMLFLMTNTVTARLAMWFGIFDYLFDYRRLRAKPAS
ncbi:MAG: YybS family protein [Bacillota bacterium]